MVEQQFKRNIAYKMRIGTLLAGKAVSEGERLKHIETGAKSVVRVNLVANVTDKYVQEGEKKFASLTLDDGSGQIKAKTFGDDIAKLAPYNQGDTLVIIGVLRSWNNEIYLTPEIVRKKDPLYLLVRKYESDAEQPKQHDREQLLALKEQLVSMVKDSEKDGGIDIDKIITNLKEPPEVINNEIKKLLEDGVAYEPRPGRLRWLG